MRAPDIPAREGKQGRGGLARRHVAGRVHFSDEQWEKIDKSLADANVDADTARWLHDKIVSYALSYSLHSLLGYARRPRTPTPRQKAAEIRDELARLDTAIKVLGEYATSYSIDFGDFVGTGLGKAKKDRAVRALHAATLALMRARTKVEQRPKEPAPPRGPRQVYYYTEYLTQLAALWTRIVPNATRRRDKHFHLRNFLRACIEPVFPTVLRDPRTGKPTDNALNSFTDRYFRRMTS
jgi:hypothetical protein